MFILFSAIFKPPNIKLAYYIHIAPSLTRIFNPLKEKTKQNKALFKPDIL